ncbi:hypothetical protein U9M48_019280 [Paspalum notatum var. saurae]|uniref:Integrase catalytic domain-containing protein n=1 Tax=Paspalum notatum var. saurae TaxID=547442 RepID=A0AAQ3WQQ8_PASNO
MEDVWIMDSGCSRHMTGHRKRFSSLNPVSTKEYITFGDNGQGKVLGVGSVSLSAKLSLREVAFVRNLGFNLVAISQLLDEGFEVHFKKGACRVLDAEETLVMISYPGELLHMDTVGPTRIASVSGKWYVLVVVDDFSRFSWVFFMEFKDEAFGFVRDLVLRLRNESHKAMRAIRSDNGGEFRNSRFENLCRDLGLEHQFSSSYTPPQNGVVERKNRTLIEMARTMLDEHRTPRRFWAEAVNTACYIANRIFLRAFLGKTSYELRFGRQPSIKHLRAFGYRCFVLMKAGHLDKFESRCLDEIFLGYASSSRAFRVWILETKQVVETCEVFFDETIPCTTPAFELSGDDDEATPIFEDEEGADNVGDAGATAPAAAPAPCATSSDDEGGPLPTASSSLSRQQAQVEAGPAEDAGEVTFEIVPSRQKEEIDYEKTFAPVARLEAIRILLAFAAFKGFKLQQIDVKSAFLNGFIEEEMSREFEMSFMGELQFFLGLQIKQGPEGTFVHQAKYTRDILKKFEMGDSKPMTTPMCTNTALDADEDGEAVKGWRCVDNALIKGEIESQ